MALVKNQKAVSSLPASLDANSIYFVRVGSGFDIYVTNNLGTIVAYPLNQEMDLHSGVEIIPQGLTYSVKLERQSINFTRLSVDGIFNLDGDLWLA